MGETGYSINYMGLFWLGKEEHHNPNDASNCLSPSGVNILCLLQKIFERLLYTYDDDIPKNMDTAPNGYMPFE